MGIREIIGRHLARYLSRPRVGGVQLATNRPETIAASLKKGDVLLFEGTSRISAAIKYLTQSNWSHAALYVGDAVSPLEADPEANVLVEADINEGVRAIPLSTYSHLHTRVCRPVGLSSDDIDNVVAYVVMRIGLRYDLKNILDLARYLIRTPPVPRRHRRRLISLGSGDPSRAICSSLIAQAFQSVRYPILPEIIYSKSDDPACVKCYEEILRIQHHSLFVPRDFDISPYFQIIKPTIEKEFDPQLLKWSRLAEEPNSGPEITSMRQPPSPRQFDFEAPSIGDQHRLNNGSIKIAN